MTRLALHVPFDPAEWWQLWTCHLTHWDVRHLLLNLIAAAPPIALARRWVLRQWLMTVPAVAPLLAMAVVASGFEGDYRGASGLVVSLWAFAGVALAREHCWQAALLLVPLILKSVGEWTGIWPVASADFATVAAIHYAGAAAGTIALLMTNGSSSIHLRIIEPIGGKP